MSVAVELDARSAAGLRVDGPTRLFELPHHCGLDRCVDVEVDNRRTIFRSDRRRRSASADARDRQLGFGHESRPGHSLTAIFPVLSCAGWGACNGVGPGGPTTRIRMSPKLADDAAPERQQKTQKRPILEHSAITFPRDARPTSRLGLKGCRRRRHARSCGATETLKPPQPAHVLVPTRENAAHQPSLSIAGAGK